MAPEAKTNKHQQPSSQASKPWTHKLGIIATVMIAAFALIAFVAKSGRPGPSLSFTDTPTLSDTKPLPDHGAIMDFELVERDGSAVSLATLKGKIWLVNFIFTKCMGPCPLMSGHMKTLQAHYEDQPDVRLLSITTDPINDTPAILQAYGERFGADAQKWLFFTGDKQHIITLSREAFKLPAGDAPDMHSTRFVLLDDKAHVRGWYDSQDADFQERIRRDVARLSKSMSH